jgi:hypothetical protein
LFSLSDYRHIGGKYNPKKPGLAFRRMGVSNAGKANTGIPKVPKQLLAEFGGRKEHPMSDDRWALLFI